MARGGGRTGGNVPFEVRDTGGQVAKVQKELRRLGDKDLMKAFYAGLNRATKPMKAAALTQGTNRLPHRGGLARRVASRTKLGTSSARGSVAVFARGRSQARLMDRGLVRHPVFGNREVWRTTRFEPGWFTDPMRAGAPIARREVMDLLDQLAREAAKRTTS